MPLGNTLTGVVDSGPNFIRSTTTLMLGDIATGQTTSSTFTGETLGDIFMERE